MRRHALLCTTAITALMLIQPILRWQHKLLARGSASRHYPVPAQISVTLLLVLNMLVLVPLAGTSFLSMQLQMWQSSSGMH